MFLAVKMGMYDRMFYFQRLTKDKERTKIMFVKMVRNEYDLNASAAADVDYGWRKEEVYPWLTKLS